MILYQKNIYSTLRLCAKFRVTPGPPLPPPDAGLTDDSLPHLAHLERHVIVMIKLSIADYGVHQVA